MRKAPRGGRRREVALDLIAAPGSSGTFLVLITDTDPMGTAGYDVAGDSFDLTLSGAPAVFFKGATQTGSGGTPYIYADSLSVVFSVPFYFPTTPTQTTDFIAADAGFGAGTYPGFTTIDPGATYALGLVSYSVSASATAGDTIGIGSGLATSLSGSDTNPVAFATTDGSITVAGSAVPEPGTLTGGTMRSQSDRS